jgi:uncharacterized protein (DUF169 family)
MELQKVNEQLNSYLRLQTFPVAVKMAGSDVEIPDKARRPKRDMGITMPVCQAISIARRYGWLMAMDLDDMLCPLGALTLGLVPAREKYLNGSFSIPFWVKSQEVRARMSQSIPRLEYGKYKGVILAPIHRADFEPQVIIIYGNPAQISRLIQSSVYGTGEPVVSRSGGGFACGQEITVPIMTDQCQIIITGGGDRAMAQTHDNEMAFSIPISRLEGIIQGLEETHRAGMRYPTTPFLQFQGQFPKAFDELMSYLKKGE